MKSWLIISSTLLSGCYPLGTRPLAEEERTQVEGMSAAIEEHARRTDDPVHWSVSRAIDQAFKENRIEVFEESLGSPHGGECDGLVVLGRMYLHSSLFGANPARGKFYSTLRLYHEGVHLTQSTCALVFEPGRSEGEARALTLRFFQEWGRRDTPR